MVNESTHGDTANADKSTGDKSTRDKFTRDKSTRDKATGDKATSDKATRDKATDDATADVDVANIPAGITTFDKLSADGVVTGDVNDADGVVTGDVNDADGVKNTTSSMDTVTADTTNNNEPDKITNSPDDVNGTSDMAESASYTDNTLEKRQRVSKIVDCAFACILDNAFKQMGATCSGVYNKKKKCFHNTCLLY